MKKISLFILIIAGLWSCEKDPDNLIVLLDQSGTLKVEIVNNNNLPFEGAEVAIIAQYGGYGDVYEGFSDENGKCDIGKLLEGHYNYNVELNDGNFTYISNSYFQIIAGDDKVLTINPFENIGDLSIRILAYNNNPYSNINVALIPHPNYSSQDYFFNDLIEEAYYLTTTDNDGVVKFIDVPVTSSSYSLLIYIDSSDYYYSGGNNSFYVTKGEENEYTMSINY